MNLTEKLIKFESKLIKLSNLTWTSAQLKKTNTTRIKIN